MSCGKVIGDKWEEFKERTQEEDEHPKEVMDDLELTRYCCRTIFMTHVDTVEEVGEHKIT
jgi:DNA-directed RNA polymerase subunit N